MMNNSESSHSSNSNVPNSGPIRLNAIKGYSNRQNNIIFCPPLIRSTNNNQDEPAHAVVYFGGDVQDTPEMMEENRDTKGYIKFNLDNTASILREAFPRSFIVVVRPVRMEFTTFSCFDNFVRGNNVGIPDHTPMHYALQHLEELLINITKKLKSMSDNELIQKLQTIPNSQANVDSEDMHIDILQVHDNVTPDADQMSFSCKEDSCNSLPTIASDLTPDFIPTPDLQTPPPTSTTAPSNPLDLLWWRDSINLDKANLTLMGFSKGCVVLNQFIYEFHYMKTLTPDDSSMMKLVSRIKEMYYLDGGHAGGKNTWITARSLLETLCRLGVAINVHVTPYQVQDDHRPWLRKEEKVFTDLLKRLGCNITRTLHSNDSTISNLFTHFEVLENFKKYHLLKKEQITTDEKEQNNQQPLQQQIIQKTPSIGSADLSSNSTT
ncbi:unnamed protein product [Chironomus riparius]|uniref:Uncharacterized protein n=1 Tax=Chironomus riparius TaxID=315576 RepID=A0A9N9RYN2_9DIPT|nr:unnamed protein product [Chironomus riparius]